MWNQTGEVDWGSEMDRHTPTGPWLCCQRSVDCMTKLGEGDGCGSRYYLARRCKWSWRGGEFIPENKLPSLHKYLCPHSKALSAALFYMPRSRHLTWTVVVMYSTDCFDFFYYLWQWSLFQMMKWRPFFLYLVSWLFLADQKITLTKTQK